MRKLIVTIVVIFVSQLSGNAQDVLTVFQKQITGSWEWVRTETVGRGSGNWVTPEICGCSKAMTISKDGKYQYFENKELLYNEPFTLLMNSVNPNVVDYFFLGGNIKLSVYLTKEDELKFGSPAGCGDIIVYKRK